MIRHRVDNPRSSVLSKRNRCGWIGGPDEANPDRAANSGAQIPYRWRGHGQSEGLEVPGVWPRLPLLPDSRLRVLLRSPRGRLRRRGDPRAGESRAHRGGPSVDLALRRPPAARRARRRAADRAPRGLHPAGARAQPGPRVGRARALRQERRGLPPDVLVQGPRGRGRGRQGARVRLRHGGVRLDRQPRELGGGPRGGGAPGVLRLHPRRPRVGQGDRDARLRPDPGGGAGDLRRRQPPLRRDRRQVPLGLRQHQPPPLLRGGLEDDGLRDRRAARLARARPRGGALRGRLAAHQDRQGLPGDGAARAHPRVAGPACTRRRRPAAGPSSP